MNKVNIELTKKELEWLKSWLQDDLDLAIENDHGKSIIKNLKHILKQFRKEVK
jgi:hypothetical protein